MQYLSQLSKCLYCIWPALVIGIAWFISRGVEGKTYYGSLTPGVDPVSPQGQAEFETRKARDAEKRKIIYWAAGIIVLGYLGALAFNTFTLRAAAAQPTATPTQTITGTATLTPTPAPATVTKTPLSQTLTATLGTGMPTYIPTATDRIVYLAGKDSVVVMTVIVYKQVTVIVTATPPSSPTPTGTDTPTDTPSLTDTPVSTETATPSDPQTPTGTDTPTQTPTPTGP
jgi:hypothetical protein